MKLRNWQAGAVRGGVNPLFPLSWAPPALTSPLTAVVTDVPSSRLINLNPGQDCILQLPTTVSDYSAIGYRDALIQVTGGRHLVVIGGHIQTKPHLFTALVGDLAAGFVNANPSWSPGQIHPNGTTVDLAENARSGLSFSGQTGTVHIEGLLIEPDPTQNGWSTPFSCLNDGLRPGFTSNTGTVLQIQNCRIGPNGPWDTLYGEDGHADCMQIVGAPGTLLMDRVTMLNATQGRGILNQSNNAYLKQATLKNVEIIKLDGAHSAYSIYDADSPRCAWSFSNVWDVDNIGAGQTFNLAGRLNNAKLGVLGPQFCGPNVPGIGYVSPGYAA